MYAQRTEPIANYGRSEIDGSRWKGTRSADRSQMRNVMNVYCNCELLCASIELLRTQFTTVGRWVVYLPGALNFQSIFLMIANNCYQQRTEYQNSDKFIQKKNNPSLTCWIDSWQMAMYTMNVENSMTVKVHDQFHFANQIDFETKSNQSNHFCWRSSSLVYTHVAVVFLWQFPVGQNEMAR